MQDFPLAGFRFYPTEEELVGFYLHNQLHGHKQHEINKVIPVLDINGIEPWNLPTLAGERCRGETEQWFFFSPRQEREARGGRPNRTTATGYWKATGSPSHVYSSHNRVIGIKKTMVFYTGKAPSGNKTKWKMHEYKAIQHSHQSNTTTHPPKLRHEFSLCRVYVISGSFGSFDRRPRLNNELQQLEGSNNNRGGKQVPAAAADRLSSTTSSGGGGRGDHGAAVTTAHDNSQVGGEPSGTNWDAVNNTVETQVEESLWEWDQLNWL